MASDKSRFIYDDASQIEITKKADGSKPKSKKEVRAGELRDKMRKTTGK